MEGKEKSERRENEERREDREKEEVRGRNVNWKKGGRMRCWRGGSGARGQCVWAERREEVERECKGYGGRRSSMNERRQCGVDMGGLILFFV